MPVSDSDISKLIRMIGGTDAFSDAELATIVATYPLDTGYDLNAAAAECWGLLAAKAAMGEERVTVDGATFDFGALLDKALKMQSHYSRQASATYTNYGAAGYTAREDVEP